MISKERKAQIARENGARSKGPVTPEGKAKVSRNAITHGERAAALLLFVPPHSAVLANEDRQKFYRLVDAALALFRPTTPVEEDLIRQYVEFQWKIERNNAAETAIFNRELLRIANSIQPSAPELREVDIAIGVQEALAANRTLTGLRRDTASYHRQVYLLQRRLAHLQKHWPSSDTREQTHSPAAQPESQLADSEEVTLPVNGPVTENVVALYRELFGAADRNLVPCPLSGDRDAPLPGEKEAA